MFHINRGGLHKKGEAMENYKFVQNKRCEFFPCHKGVSPEQFNCLFCFCPLYALGDQCGGSFRYLESGVKDCTRCIRPHNKEGYEFVAGKIDLLVEMARKKADDPPGTRAGKDETENEHNEKAGMAESGIPGSQADQ